MKSKIPILFVIANAEFSGAERQLLLLASHLDKTKFEAEVCCLEGEGTFTEEVIKAGLPLHIIKRRRSFDIGRLIRLTKLIKQKKYQIVHSFTWSANQYTRLARLFVRFKLVSGERGRDLIPINIENIIDSLLYCLSDCIVFNSSIQSQKYRHRNSSIRVIQNGIDLNKFQNNKLNNIKSSLGLSKESIVIGTVGNFTAHKNFEMFVKVCEKVIFSDYNIHFVAIGDGRNKDHYAELIKQRKIESKLTLVGRIKNIEKVIHDLDVFLLTSTWEGMPNVILEAMASGVTVIATNVDGCKEIIRDGVNGYLVDVDDVENMVSRIMLLLNNMALRQKIIHNGLQTIQSKFLLEKMVNAYESVYTMILKRMLT